MSFTTLLNIAKNTIDFLVKFGKEYGKKSLVGLALCIVLTVLICGTSSYYTHKHVDNALTEYRDTIKQDMYNTLIEYEDAKDSIHHAEEVKVIERQSAIKSALRSERKTINCDYIAICQFHNNVESISGCQFIKFDITYNIHAANLSAIDIDEFQNTSISKYDIIPLIWNKNTSVYTVQQIKEEDDLLYTQLTKYAPTVNKIVFTHITIDNNRDGIIMYMFNKNQEPDFEKINNCTDQINELIK